MVQTKLIEKFGKNLILLIIIKSIGIITSLSLIPLSIKILGEYKYGVWVIVFNIVTWVSILDLGLGNGFRNIFTSYVAKGELRIARKYLGISYISSLIIAAASFIFLLIIIMGLDLPILLNIEQLGNAEINKLIVIALFFALLLMIVKLVDIVLLALHKPHLSVINSTISNLLVLIMLVLVKDKDQMNLAIFAIIFCGTPVLVTSLTSIFLYNGYLRKYAPIFCASEMKYIKKIFRLGGQFFLIQTSMLILFSTDNIIISKLLSPNEVTVYNVILRYFGLISTFIGIILTPLWSVYTEAFVSNNLGLIKKIINYQLLGFFILIPLVILWNVLADLIIPVWINENLSYSKNLTNSFSIYTILLCWNSIFSTVLGALSLIRLGTYITIISAIVNIPLSIYLVEIFGNDSSGVILATISCIGITSVLSPIQVYYFLYSKHHNPKLNALLR